MLLVSDVFNISDEACSASSGSDLRANPIFDSGFCWTIGEGPRFGEDFSVFIPPDLFARAHNQIEVVNG